MARPPKIITETIHDIDVAKRYALFRKQIIDKSQDVAAKKLGIGQGHLSQIESGQRPIPAPVLAKSVEDYNLDTEWLYKNLGSMVLNNPEKPSAANSLSAALTAIKSLEHAIQSFQAQLSGAYKRIEQQDQKIAALQKRMDKMEDGK